MHWLDLNTLTYWGAILAAIVAIGTILGWFLKPLSWWRSRTKSKFGWKNTPITFVPNDLHCHWSEGRLNDRPCTVVHGRWHVTNASVSAVMILKARLGKRSALTSFAAAKDPDDERQSFGEHPIRPHSMSEVMAYFDFCPAIHRRRDPIIIDVIFTDNFTNEYRVKTKFRCDPVQRLMASS